MPEGLIIKALSGYYYVLPDQESQTVQCRARGVFKKRGISPLVGDRVVFEHSENGEGTVAEVLPRTSELIRPPVANVDLAVLVFSVSEPSLNLQLLDKFLVHTEKAGLDSIICFTKHDLLREDSSASEEQYDSMLSDIVNTYESIGYPVIVTSSFTGAGVERVKDYLAGRIGVFAGQSGVGKSSLLNAIVPGLSLETNEISMKLGRGKHTTRHVELIRLENGGIVADTPGFSQLDFLELEPEELGGCYPEFAPLAERCKFRGCLHLKEPDCRVRSAAESGEIAGFRYEHYVSFITEMKDKKRRY
jgi:ribosome biogenesis GTPase / thiamine phosphate phosphatase